ncbi:MAG: VOC family protein [Actinobacteria bacterium]|nr:VOC family protein [Actinomycetota bacterium]
MEITFEVVVFDAADLAAESSFWAGVLGGTVDAEDDWHMVSVDGRPRIGVQLAPNHVPPEWPDGVPQQVHLDLWVDDPAEAHELVMSPRRAE